MKARRIDSHAGEETCVLVFDAGEEAMEGLTAFARERKLTAAHLSGIGAFSDVTLGYFDWERKDYRPIPVDEQVEVVSLLGDVALNDGEPVVHAHVVVSGPDGIAHGGHLLGGRVRPTLEVVLTTSPATLRKRHDPESGLALIDLSDAGSER
jgi:uncharacterized protein